MNETTLIKNMNNLDTIGRVISTICLITIGIVGLIYGYSSVCFYGVYGLLSALCVILILLAFVKCYLLNDSPIHNLVHRIIFVLSYVSLIFVGITFSKYVIMLFGFSIGASLSLVVCLILLLWLASFDITI